MTAKEIGEWYAFFTLEPWGCREDWKRAAQIMAVTANVHSGKGGRVFRESDFAPDYKPPAPAQTVDDHRHMIEMIAAAAKASPKHGLKVVRRDH